MKIIPITTPPPPSALETAATRYLAHINSGAMQAVERHKLLYTGFWDSPHTPDDLLAQMGPLAGKMLQAASESVRHLTELAAIAGVALFDLIPPEYVIPRRAFIPHDDGTVTLEPPEEGHDAWGRPIPDPEPEPIPLPTD